MHGVLLTEDTAESVGVWGSSAGASGLAFLLASNFSAARESHSTSRKSTNAIITIASTAEQLLKAQQVERNSLQHGDVNRNLSVQQLPCRDQILRQHSLLPGQCLVTLRPNMSW